MAKLKGVNLDGFKYLTIYHTETPRSQNKKLNKKLSTKAGRGLIA
jgi:hypothetical protein